MQVERASAEDEGKLRELCREALAAQFPAAVGDQLCRVLRRMFPDKVLDPIRSREQLHALCRRASFIPDSVIRGLWALAVPAPVETAIALAACAYPSRVYQFCGLSEELEKSPLRPSKSPRLAAVQKLRRNEFETRARTFVQFWKDISPGSDLRMRVGEKLRLRSLGIDTDEFLWDFALPGENIQKFANEKPEEAEARLNGAALWFTTYDADWIDYVKSCWETEHEFVRAYCEANNSLLSPPSAQCNQAGSFFEVGSETIQRRLEANVPKLAAHSGLLVALEREIWKRALDRRVRADFISDKVKDYWEHQLEKLTSGFPYFSYRSTFLTWWKDCLTKEFFIERGGGSPPGKPYPSPQQPPGGTPTERLSLDTLPTVRGAYRFVRSTFFDRDRKDPEKTRWLVDQLWARRTEFPKEEGETVKVTIRSIARNSGISEDTLASYNRRLGERVRAFCFGRFRRLGEDFMTRFPFLSGKRADDEKTCLTRDSTTLRLHRLGATVPPEQPLLSFFTSYVLHQGALDAEWDAPWTSRQLFREYWHWIAGDDPADALNLGEAVADGAFDEGFADYLRRPQPAEILSQALNSGFENWCNYLEGIDIPEICDIFDPILKHLLPRNGGTNEAKQILRALPSETLSEWIIPVFYHSILNGRDIAEIFQGTITTKREEDAVLSLESQLHDSFGLSQRVPEARSVSYVP